MGKKQYCISQTEGVNTRITVSGWILESELKRRLRAIIALGHDHDRMLDELVEIAIPLILHGEGKEKSKPANCLECEFCSPFTDAHGAQDLFKCLSPIRPAHLTEIGHAQGRPDWCKDKEKPVEFNETRDEQSHVIGLEQHEKEKPRPEPAKGNMWGKEQKQGMPFCEVCGSYHPKGAGCTNATATGGYGTENALAPTRKDWEEWAERGTSEIWPPMIFEGKDGDKKRASVKAWLLAIPCAKEQIDWAKELISQIPSAWRVDPEPQKETHDEWKNRKPVFWNEKDIAEWVEATKQWILEEPPR